MKRANKKYLFARFFFLRGARYLGYFPDLFCIVLLEAPF